MARRRSRPREELAPEHLAVPRELTAADMLDPRVVLDPAIPDAAKATAIGLLRYARSHAPEAVLTSEQARARRRRRDALAAWTRACVESRRAGQPRPHPDLFLNVDRA